MNCLKTHSQVDAVPKPKFWIPNRLYVLYLHSAWGFLVLKKSQRSEN